MYCMKCKKKTSTKDEKIVKSGNRSRNTGKCSVCGTNKSVFVSSQAGKGETEFKLSKSAYDKEAPKEVDGYKLDEELSKGKTRVYNNSETGKTIVAHRGTDVKSKADLKDDALIALGLFNKKNSKRLRTADEITKKAGEKYGNNEITHTGHSLAGAVASKVQKEGQKVETYNKGASITDIPANLIKKTKCAINGDSKECKKINNQTHYTTGVDPISVSNLIGNPSKVKLVKPSKLNVHGIDNFENLHKKQEGKGIDCKCGKK